MEWYICQGKKLVKTVNSQNERIFLHPYFDQFILEQIVILEIKEPFNSCEIKLLANPNLNKTDLDLVSRHLSELDIHKRYSHFFRDEYMRLQKNVAKMKENNQNIKSTLESFCYNAKNKAINSWGHIFYSGVLSNAKLMSFLEKDNSLS